jgi:hypothetical protein
LIIFNHPKHLLLWGGATLGLSLLGVGLRLYYEPAGPETLPGGDRVALTYGVIVAALIAFAWALAGLRFVPSWWFIGSRALWLKGHIWLSLLSFVLVLCHSGLRFGGLFEQLLYVVFFLVVLTGIFGLILQQFLPRWMTIEVPCEVPYEQIPNVCNALREKADLEIDSKCVAPVAATCERIKQWYADEVRPFLGWPSRSLLLSDASKTAQVFAQMRALPGVDHATSKIGELLNRLEEYCTDRRRLARQETLHRLLHSWLYLHIPLSAALVVMMIAHAVITLYY